MWTPEVSDFTKLLEIILMGPVDKEQQKAYSHDIVKVLSTMNSRESIILTLKYVVGLQNEQVGFILGVTRERIRQLHATALRKIRHPTRKKFLIKYKI